MTHASRALASEELVAEAMKASGSKRPARRLRVLRKRWERSFERRLKEIDARRKETAAELNRLGEGYREVDRVRVGGNESEGGGHNPLGAAEGEPGGAA